MVKAQQRPIAAQKVHDAKRVLPMPPFSMKDLRSAIPAHLFERSALKSFSYVFMDMALIAGLVYLASFISMTPYALRLILWPLYWVACGSVATGLWVIAHECGHQAFSDYKWLNDAVGLVLHSALLVPYHAWRITHGMHHKNTNHMDRDQVFVPSLRSEVQEALSESPLWNLYYIIVTVTAGWPAYLIANISGQDYGRRTNHFEPASPVFKPKQRTDIIVSNFGLVVVLALLGVWSYQTSLSTMICWYFMPYLVVNFFLVTITLLQHTHRDVPHYRGDEWTFIRGALSTIDRNYGWVLNHLHHHIADSHVVHHLFSTMPHYNAVEATKHIKPMLGKYYMSDDTNFLKVLWLVYSECKFVEDEGEVLFYRSALDDDGSKPSIQKMVPFKSKDE